MNNPINKRKIQTHEHDQRNKIKHKEKQKED